VDAQRVRRILLRILYWVAVLAVSLVLVLFLVLLFESLDDSSVDQGSARPPQPAGQAP
jgi:hypothetical protein